MSLAPLALPKVPIRLLVSFDFDDTLWDEHGHPPIVPEFAEAIKNLRAHGLLWVINTGRDLAYAREGLFSAGLDFAPDFLITRERDIHQASYLKDWHELQPWNSRCAQKHHQLFKQLAAELARLRGSLEQQFALEWYAEIDEPCAIVANYEQDMPEIRRQVAQLCSQHPELSYQSTGPYLRFCHSDYDKGKALAKVASLWSLAHTQCAVIGDGHNDLAAMQSHIAAHIAAPANASAEVKAHVAQLGGYQCRQARSRGALEWLQQVVTPLLQG